MYGLETIQTLPKHFLFPLFWISKKTHKNRSFVLVPRVIKEKPSSLMTLQFLFYFFLKLILSEIVSTLSLNKPPPYPFFLTISSQGTWIQLWLRFLVMRAGQFIILINFSFGYISQTTPDYGWQAFPS